MFVLGLHTESCLEQQKQTKIFQNHIFGHRDAGRLLSKNKSELNPTGERPSCGILLVSNISSAMCFIGGEIRKVGP